MEEHKCLAYIWPMEEYQNKETATANVKFINGPFAGRTASYRLTTEIYRYYFMGVTFEMVTVTNQGTITAVADVSREYFTEFGLGILYAVTFNCMTHEVLASDGFVFKLDQSLFFRNCQSVCKRIYEEISTAQNFVMYLYTLNGGIISVLFDKNVAPRSSSYKYAIFKGFVTGDNRLLRSMIPQTAKKREDGKILKQSDIDRLIGELQKETLI